MLAKLRFFYRYANQLSFLLYKNNNKVRICNCYKVSYCKKCLVS